MAERVKTEDVARRLAERMETDEATAAAWLDGVVETLFDCFKEGQSVTLPGFGGFYVRPERESWVFKFNPSQRLRAVLGWSSTYKGNL
jgi:hypothetical protein